MKAVISYAIAIYIAALLILVMILMGPTTQQLAVNWLSGSSTPYGAPPDFAALTQVNEKKDAFFGYFAPIIHDENERVLQQRETILAIAERFKQNGKISKKDSKTLEKYSKIYRVDETEDREKQIEQLLNKVYLVPASLGLAQAANESAWGTSRFATLGNNYFGQWCFTKNCGMVPNARNTGASHEVRVFKSPAASVRAYILNINSHPAYEKLRHIRADLVSKGEFPSGIKLAEGLEKYSERGDHYIEELRAMIRVNDLQDYNRQSLAKE